jgi:hypothetical protein
LPPEAVPLALGTPKEAGRSKAGWIWVARDEVMRGTDWPGRPLSRMKRLRYQRPTLGIGLIMALAIGTVAGVFGYYGVLIWRFFFD